MTTGAFPALSVRQPWAELIVSGKKSIEIRRWQRSYRGRICIHAAKHVDEFRARLTGKPCSAWSRGCGAFQRD